MNVLLLKKCTAMFTTMSLTAQNEFERGQRRQDRW